MMPPAFDMDGDPADYPIFRRQVCPECGYLYGEHATGCPEDVELDDQDTDDSEDTNETNENTN